MTKEIWFNLPVKDLATSITFFTKLGFGFNSQFGDNETCAGLSIGDKNVIVMLFREAEFNAFTGHPKSDAHSACEVIISFSAETRGEVDEMAEKVKAAGGDLFGKPQEIQGWMYGCAFSDPDGHRWNMLHMDFTKLPK